MASIFGFLKNLNTHATGTAGIGSVLGALALHTVATTVPHSGCHVGGQRAFENLSAKSRMTQWRQSDYFSKPSCRIAACTVLPAAGGLRRAA